MAEEERTRKEAEKERARKDAEEERARKEAEAFFASHVRERDGGMDTRFHIYNTVFISIQLNLQAVNVCYTICYVK